MTAHRQTVYVDDWTGQELSSRIGMRTVTITVDGFRYDFDLTVEGREQLNAALAPILARSRRMYGRNATAAAREPAPRVIDGAEIRRWARRQGIPVGARGRISEQVQRAYAEAKR